MASKAPKKSVHDRMIDAEVRGNKWLADANEAAEKGDHETAEKYYAKGQFWLDRYNLLAGIGEKPAPKR